MEGWIKDFDVLQCTIPYTVHIKGCSGISTTRTFSGYMTTYSVSGCLIHPVMFAVTGSCSKAIRAEGSSGCSKKIWLSITIQSDLKSELHCLTHFGSKKKWQDINCNIKIDHKYSMCGFDEEKRQIMQHC